MSQPAYRPGEKARTDLSVRDAVGRTMESALGLVVFDKAVEERALTDQGLRAGPGFAGSIQSWLYDDEAVGGIRRRDLDALDMSKPLPEGIELAAEILLRRRGWFVQAFEGGDEKKCLQVQAKLPEFFLYAADEDSKSSRWHSNQWCSLT
jgi:hypothetical protein